MSRFVLAIGLVCAAVGWAVAGGARVGSGGARGGGANRALGGEVVTMPGEERMLRLERDCEGQYLRMKYRGRQGEWTLVQTLHGEVRSMEWSRQTKHHRLYRHIYFAKGHPQLVVESRKHKLASGAAPRSTAGGTGWAIAARGRRG